MYHTRLHVKCEPEFSEILIAELAEANFEGFLENDDGFEAYVEGDAFNPDSVENIRRKYEAVTPLQFSFSQIPKKNWNEEWEKSFSPIVVEGKCVIRASFHQPEQRFAYEIIITPKMSFGTGHHQTTYLMVKNMMNLDHVSKRVMDAGCGTAVLSIMASKLGATEVEAFDIDEWSVENGNENIDINQCANIRISRGKINEVDLNGKFDIILANINKNVLLNEIGAYASYLNREGILLLSGFFISDIPELLKAASLHGLVEISRDDRDSWASLSLQSTAD